MRYRHLSRALASAVAVAAATLGQPVAAQQIDRIVAFGDSYADDNNALQLGLIPPALLPLYPTGRFTGGTNYVDTLSQLLNAPIENFAIGGARANPDFLTEIGAFAAGGGGVFPTVTPSFDEGDLVTISIGGNDARAYGSLPGASVAGAPAAAAPAIAATTAGIDTLVAAGAPTISFLAGNTGELPEVAGNPAVAAIRSAYSNAFNQGVQTALAGYAADGVIVHYLDLSPVLAQVSADPAAFGLTGVVCPAFPNPTCIANAGAGFLIYGDLLHPTSQGSAIIARYIATQLAAPLTLQAPSDLGYDAAQQFGRTLSTRADFGAEDSGPQSGGMRVFLVGDTFSRDVNDSDDNSAFDIDGVGLTAGVEMPLGGGVAGVALNYTRPRVRFGDDSSRINGRSWQIGGYAGTRLGAMSLQGHVGFGWDRHRIRREGVLEEMTARPRGTHMTAGAKAGYLLPMGALNLGPVAAVDFARAKVRGYTEDGDPALTLNVGSQRLSSLTGGVGVEAQANLTTGGSGIKPFVSAMLEHDFTGDDRAIAFSQTSAPVIVNSWTVDGSRETYGRLSGGASAALFGTMSINAAVTATFGQNSGDELGAHIGLRAGF